MPTEHSKQHQQALLDIAKEAADAAEALVPYGMKVVVFVQDERDGCAAFFSQLPLTEALQLFRRTLRDHGVA